MYFPRSKRLIFITIVCLFGLLALPVKAGFVQDPAQTASIAPKLTEEEMKQFLLTAKVTKARQTEKGVTNPWRLTLSDGKLTHDAVFQSIDESKASMALTDGRTEIGFRDSWHFNIAAYEIAKLLGLGHMMPVTVQRKWGPNNQFTNGSLSWWLDTQMDLAKRIEKNIQPPDPEAWNKEVDDMMVFGELVYDTDRNRTNVLIGPNWELYMIDFTRAFRMHQDLTPKGKSLEQCSRQLLEKLRQMDSDEVTRITKNHLIKGQVKALMARRDKLVAWFDNLVAQKGESAVLF